MQTEQTILELRQLYSVLVFSSSTKLRKSSGKLPQVKACYLASWSYGFRIIHIVEKCLRAVKQASINSQPFIALIRRKDQKYEILEILNYQALVTILLLSISTSLMPSFVTVLTSN